MAYLDLFFDYRCTEQDIKEAVKEIQERGYKALVDYKVKRVISDIPIMPRLFKKWKIQSYNYIERGNENGNNPELSSRKTQIVS